VTGTHIAQTLGLPLVAWKDMHETGGIFLEDPETGERVGLPGRTRAYFRQHHPHLVLPDGMDPGGWWNRSFEEREERQPRAMRVARLLDERHGGTDDHVAVVSHGGFYNHLLCAILDLPQRRDYWFIMNNTGITRIDLDEDSTRVIYMNRTDFLPDELIT
jgi:2,3-bisphosphoglycerate-dependent phosphoglycerate mutase